MIQSGNNCGINNKKKKNLKIKNKFDFFNLLTITIFITEIMIRKYTYLVTCHCLPLIKIFIS